MPQFEGSEEIKAPLKKVFEFITNPENFSKGIPDIEEISVKSQDSFRVIAKLGISFLKGRFTTDFTVKEKREPEFISLYAHGSGLQSMVDANIKVNLISKNGSCLMKWEVDLKISGMIASLGQRVIEPVIKKIVDEIFGNIKRNVEKF
ncbi:MAG: carbon monoxide dehydrogenase subunit G [Nitrososphaerales archaeon]